MVAILIISAKLATLSLLKIKLFWNKVYDIIISAHGVTNKILLHDSYYIVNAVMWPKFDNCSISMREVIITLFYMDLAKKPSVAKGLNLKVRKLWWLIFTFVEVTYYYYYYFYSHTRNRFYWVTFKLEDINRPKFCTITFFICHYTDFGNGECRPTTGLFTPFYLVTG